MLVSRFANASSNGLASKGVVAGASWTGLQTGNFDAVIDTVTDTAGRTYTLSSNCKLMVTDVDGNLMAQFTFIANPSATLYATALAIDTSGYVYVLANDNAFANFLYRVVFNGTTFTQQWGKTWTDTLFYTKLAFNSTYSIMHVIGVGTSAGVTRIQIVDVDSTLGTYKRLTRISHGSLNGIIDLAGGSCFNGTLKIAGSMQWYITTPLPGGFCANRGFVHTCSCTSAGITLATISSSYYKTLNGDDVSYSQEFVQFRSIISPSGNSYVVGSTVQYDIVTNTYAQSGYVQDLFAGTQVDLKMLLRVNHILPDASGFYVVGDHIVPGYGLTTVLLSNTNLLPIGTPTTLTLASNLLKLLNISKTGSRFSLTCTGDLNNYDLLINSLPSNLSIPVSTWTINGLTYTYVTSSTTNSPGTLLTGLFTASNSNVTVTLTNSTLVPTATTKIWNRQNI